VNGRLYEEETRGVRVRARKPQRAVNTGMGVFVHLNAEIRVEPLDPREPVAIYPEHLQVLEPLPVVLAVCVSMHPCARTCGKGQYIKWGSRRSHCGAQRAVSREACVKLAVNLSH